MGERDLHNQTAAGSTARTPLPGITPSPVDLPPASPLVVQSVVLDRLLALITSAQATLQDLVTRFAAAWAAFEREPTAANAALLGSLRQLIEQFAQAQAAQGRALPPLPPPPPPPQLSTHPGAPLLPEALPAQMPYRQDLAGSAFVAGRPSLPAQAPAPETTRPPPAAAPSPTPADRPAQAAASSLPRLSPLPQELTDPAQLGFAMAGMVGSRAAFEEMERFRAYAAARGKLQLPMDAPPLPQPQPRYAAPPPPPPSRELTPPQQAALMSLEEVCRQAYATHQASPTPQRHAAWGEALGELERYRAYLAGLGKRVPAMAADVWNAARAHAQAR